MDACDLTARHCVPCRGGIPPMEADKARELIQSTPGWSLSEDVRKISRRFTFQDFRQAMKFVNHVADIAEAEGHHPDIAIHWNLVDLVVYTHKIDGLHENDFILAAKVDALHQSSM